MCVCFFSLGVFVIVSARNIWVKCPMLLQPDSITGESSIQEKMLLGLIFIIRDEDKETFSDHNGDWHLLKIQFVISFFFWAMQTALIKIAGFKRRKNKKNMGRIFPICETIKICIATDEAVVVCWFSPL